ncbi:MerR family transcriptional regulator [Anaerocolumna xylanovorans]|uniref:DNA-binding transcriptional regulator, MerR family n=1 Tax=Anaerocolumna xylanovorans DSM 12503 TaxID=1121345 RepID=A0A1M7XZR1_9FIRM|nr:MerR family transcriptional regulator [Anaerocolumna xylanovorans]SHO44720.1 DNA-binding transcriptional regulator, MerR family [Anaerocolumna xylanovorans DSM 12503]
MYTMKNVCDKLHIPYETLRYYCNEGLVPNVKRDHNNYRIFDDRDLNWLGSLQCLRKCGLSIKEIKEYLNLCLEGPSSIKIRKTILAVKKENLLKEIESIEESIVFIDYKQDFYDDVLAGKIKYTSNLISIE